jgi:DNA-binding NarL/FixJ family response regulator
MYEDERFVGHLMDCGAAGYLLKSTDPAEIKRAIMDVMRTGFYLNPFVNKVLIKKNYSKQKFNPSLTTEVVLSEREKEVLTLVCMEFTASEIAQKMSISARTVEAIKDRLMERFGVKNSVGLVFYAMKNQLID